jgi:tetratricopeptide (TPR) repeat protein
VQKNYNLQLRSGSAKIICPILSKFVLAPMRYNAIRLTSSVARLVWTLVFVVGLRCVGNAQESVPPAIENRIASGVAFLKAGDLDNAERAFNSLLTQGVKSALVFHNLGVIAQQRGKHQEAATRFRDALRFQPNYGPSRLLLGSSLLALGQTDGAIGELKRAIALMPTEPSARLELAKAYEAGDNWFNAVEQLRKLVSLVPDNAEYSYQLGKASTKLSGWALSQIQVQHPNSARLHQALGQEYAIQEKYDEALAAYQQAALADPKLPEIHLGVALILLQLKRFDAALTEVNLELQLIPESKRAADTKARIEQEKSAASP